MAFDALNTIGDRGGGAACPGGMVSRVTLIALLAAWLAFGHLTEKSRATHAEQDTDRQAPTQIAWCASFSAHTARVWGTVRRSEG